MKPNKKYMVDGIQCAMYPNPIMNITQSINGATSHRGTFAIDDAQADTGRSNGYAPCDMVCVATDYVNGNAIFWQSVKPVKTVKYGVTYIYMMVIHDNTANARVGMTIKQGELLFTEGTAGMATGNHNHIEVGIGKFPGTMYIKSGYLTSWGAPVYMMPGNVNPSDVFFTDDTQIINGGGLNWRKLGQSSSDQIELIEEKGVATFISDTPITVHRDGPSGLPYGSMKKGEKQAYTHKYIGNGHRYIVYDYKGVKCFVAVSAGESRNSEYWATFSLAGEEEKPSKWATHEPNPKAVKMRGVDVSDNNGIIDIKDQDFVIIKVSGGTIDDKLFKYYLDQVNKYNIPYGLYHYSYALNEDQMREETKYFLDKIKGLHPALGCWCDMEDADGWKKKHGVLTKEWCSKVTNYFCDTVHQAGYFVGYYTSLYWIKNLVDCDYPKWIADWGNNDAIRDQDLSKVCMIHQYSSCDHLDKNVIYADLDDFKSEHKSDNDEIKQILDEIIERVNIAKSMLG